MPSRKLKNNLERLIDDQPDLNETSAVEGAPVLSQDSVSLVDKLESLFWDPTIFIFIDGKCVDVNF